MSNIKSTYSISQKSAQGTSKMYRGLYAQKWVGRLANLALVQLKRQLQLNQQSQMPYSYWASISFTNNGGLSITADVIWLNRLKKLNRFKRKRDLRQQVSTRKDIRYFL